METIEIKSVKSWKRDVIEYLEDLKFICNDYNRTILRYLGKLNRLLKASEAINDIPRTILDTK